MARKSPFFGLVASLKDRPSRPALGIQSVCQQQWLLLIALLISNDLLREFGSGCVAATV